MPLCVNGLEKTYGEKKVLDGFSLDFPEHGVACLFGPSGCGKTTLMNCMAGLTKPDAGTVSGAEGLKISCVFQEDRLLPWLSARENIAAVFRDKKEGGRAAGEWLNAFGLGEDAELKPAELSGGMCRRVSLARALAFGGDFFLLDEPFQRLDARSRDNALALVERETRGRLAVLITHNIAEMEKMANVAYILDGPPLKIVDIVRKKS